MCEELQDVFDKSSHRNTIRGIIQLNKPVATALLGADCCDGVAPGRVCAHENTCTYAHAYMYMVLRFVCPPLVLGSGMSRWNFWSSCFNLK